MDGILSVENFDTSLAEGLMLLTPFSTTEESSKAFTELISRMIPISPLNTPAPESIGMP